MTRRASKLLIATIDPKRNELKSAELFTNPDITPARPIPVDITIATASSE